MSGSIERKKVEEMQENATKQKFWPWLDRLDFPADVGTLRVSNYILKASIKLGSIERKKCLPTTVGRCISENRKWFDTASIERKLQELIEQKNGHFKFNKSNQKYNMFMCLDGGLEVSTMDL